MSHNINDDAMEITTEQQLLNTSTTTTTSSWIRRGVTTSSDDQTATATATTTNNNNNHHHHHHHHHNTTVTASNTESSNNVIRNDCDTESDVGGGLVNMILLTSTESGGTTTTTTTTMMSTSSSTSTDCNVCRDDDDDHDNNEGGSNEDVVDVDTTTINIPTTTTTTNKNNNNNNNNDVVDRLLKENPSPTTSSRQEIAATCVQQNNDVDKEVVEKDIYVDDDVLTPEALVRVASNSVMMTDTKVPAIVESSRLNHDVHDTHSATSLLQHTQIHNTIDKEMGCYDHFNDDDDDDDEEADVDKLLASVPPELVRRTGNPSSISSAISQPGAYHHYNTSSSNPPITSTNTTSLDEEEEEQEQGRNDRRHRLHRQAEGESNENVLIEATLVVEEEEEENSTIPTARHGSSQLPSPPPPPQVETAPVMVVVSPPPLYSAQIVNMDEESLHVQNIQQHNLEPFSISGNGNVVISKTKLRCILYIIFLVLCVSILAITLPLVLIRRDDENDNDDKIDKGEKRKKYTPYEFDTILLQQKQKILLQNYDRYQSITHHISVITFQNNKILYSNTTTLNTTTNSSINTVCLPLYDNHFTNNYASSSQSPDDSSRSEDEPDRFGDTYFDDYIDYDGILVTMKCGDGSADPTVPPMILLHNDELLSSTYSNIFNTSQWSNYTDQNLYIEIPKCYNFLFFPPDDKNDDEVKGDNEEKDDKKPKKEIEDIWNHVNSTIYGTYQCRIYPLSPYNDLIEQFIFVYSCINSGNDTVDNMGLTTAADTDKGPIVTSTHLQNLVTNCYSADPNATLDLSPPTTTNVSLSMQRLCQRNNNESDIVVPIRQQQQQSSSGSSKYNDTNMSSLYLCRTSDGIILNTTTVNYDNSNNTNDVTSTRTNTTTTTSNLYEYCSTYLDVTPSAAGTSEIFDIDIQTWCQYNNIDDATLIQFCNDLQSSTSGKYIFYEYLIPNMTMIDHNFHYPISDTTTTINDSLQCRFDSFSSSFFKLAAADTTTPTNVEMESTPTKTVPITLSILGNGGSSTIKAMNLREILLDVLEQQQQ